MSPVCDILMNPPLISARFFFLEFSELVIYLSKLSYFHPSTPVILPNGGITCYTK